MDKRTFLKTGALLGLGATFADNIISSPVNQIPVLSNIDKVTDQTGKYVLPELPFKSDALEPFIDKQTVEIHHDKHHAGYVNGLNNAVSKIKEANASNDYAIIKYWEKEMSFNGSGHFLHTLYWNNLSASKGKRSKKLDEYMNQSFGSYDVFVKYFTAATTAVEGAGWGILAYQLNGDRLVILQSEIHQNLSQWISVPILVCDVWEHAYYLKYQNKRGEYVNNFFNLINWEIVSQRLDNLLSLNVK
jgi:Fe-Mn family superoxide dismutase